ncbi:hypothetical protein ACFE04_020049 [Oxalis oulophora]
MDIDDVVSPRGNSQSKQRDDSGYQRANTSTGVKQNHSSTSCHSPTASEKVSLHTGSRDSLKSNMMSRLIGDHPLPESIMPSMQQKTNSRTSMMSTPAPLGSSRPSLIGDLPNFNICSQIIELGGETSDVGVGGGGVLKTGTIPFPNTSNKHLCMGLRDTNDDCFVLLEITIFFLKGLDFGVVYDDGRSTTIGARPLKQLRHMSSMG